jgi:hypothetical protein
MAIAEADLESRIDEISGGDAELRKTLLEALGKSDKAKTNFVNGFLGRADVTRKQQELADQRKQFEIERTNLQTQVAEYESRITAAEEEKYKIMRDLADRTVSVATANARLQAIKERWQLSDDDLPLPADVKKTAASGTVVDSTADIDTRMEARFKKFKEDLIGEIGSKLIPEMGALAEIPRVLANIDSEHRELFGKGLTKAERDEVMKMAKEKKDIGGIVGAWESKYNVSAERTKIHDKAVADAAIKKYEEERIAKATADALAGRNPETLSWSKGSPLLDKKFAVKVEPTADGPGAYPKPTSAADRVKQSGAERARARFEQFKQSNGASEGISINRGGRQAAA